MTTHVGVGECAVCRGTGGGGFHGYYGIPACQCDGGGVILRPHCLHCLTKKKMRMKRMKKRRRFSSVVHCPGAQCQNHLPGDPVPLLEESSGAHLHTGAPLQC